MIRRRQADLVKRKPNQPLLGFACLGPQRVPGFGAFVISWMWCDSISFSSDCKDNIRFKSRGLDKGSKLETASGLFDSAEMIY